MNVTTYLPVEFFVTEVILTKGHDSSIGVAAASDVTNIPYAVGMDGLKIVQVTVRSDAAVTLPVKVEVPLTVKSP